MQRNPHIFFILFFVAASFTVTTSFAQLGFDLDIKKPEPFENRELKAEKTGEKKFKLQRRFFQNTTTHYNYFFNANNKINEVIERAKEAHVDDYSQLLPFYNYSLQFTINDKQELDSVIYKSKTGIVLHDLRNDWIDNLYLLWGASYYLQQEFDSAYQMFQFINYAFAEKEKDGYYRYIGSRMDGNNASSIATKEKNSFPKSAISEPPSRNDAFIWQIRTLIQTKQFAEAASLIATLKNDPVFPKRLHSHLQEVQAFWFYNQNVWDSAAYYLVGALDVTNKKREKARWEYLAAQMFERNGLLEEAKKYYNLSIAHTTDPVMDIYARLNLIRINKEGGDNYIDQNIADLLKMAKREKFVDHRDIIYSMAAQMELERGNLAAAQALLERASKYKSDNPVLNNKAYMQLAELAYGRKAYAEAASFYDSISIPNVEPEDADKINDRKALLSKWLKEATVIERQDSLLHLASISEEERSSILKKKVRQLRKLQGLNEEEATVTSGNRSANKTTSTPDLFNSQQKGEWYFYNNNLKTNGSALFKQNWGNRPNVDNWRRFSDVTAQLRSNVPANIRSTSPVEVLESSVPTFDGLLAKIPLTPEQQKISNDSILNAYKNLAFLYVNEMGDYPSAIETYEIIRKRFGIVENEETLFHMYTSYRQTGNISGAEELKRKLQSQYPGGRFTTIVTTGTDPQSDVANAEVTKTYEAIYDTFLEGKFEEALEAKRKADEKYKTNYWSPQLLYIEAIYHIQQRDDSIAKNVLYTLVAQNAGTPMGSRAENLLQVLNRRHEIEEELRNLQIQRPVEDTLYVEPMPVAPSVQRRDAVVINKKDSLTAKPIVAKAISDTVFKTSAPVIQSSLFNFKPESQQYVAVVLNKVDVVFVNETRNAFARFNREKFYNQTLNVKIESVNDDIKLVLISQFNNAQAAIDYILSVKPVTASQIVPWLKNDKYTFTIISEENLNTVTDTKDFSAYEKFLDQNLPVKF
ncbi:MAG: tetratricopeptide repeat protein [Bacteroidota bacterium]|nr:tetratricopeptide repeat protein [Bacteroidota bacterium]